MPVAEQAPQTLYDKVLQAHIVDEKLDGTILLYIGWFFSVYPPSPIRSLPVIPSYRIMELLAISINFIIKANSMHLQLRPASGP